MSEPQSAFVHVGPEFESLNLHKLWHPMIIFSGATRMDAMFVSKYGTPQKVIIA